MPPGAVRIHGLLDDDHGGWSYQTMVADAGREFEVYPASREAPEVAWVPADRVEALPLHPGFAVTWPVIRAAMAPVTVIVDGANVMGARADGWWRDRAGAAARLYGELAALAGRGVAELPADLAAGSLDRWFPGYVLVVEGQARAAGARAPGDRGGARRRRTRLRRRHHRRAGRHDPRAAAGGHRRPGTAPPGHGRGGGGHRPPVAAEPAVTGRGSAGGRCPAARARSRASRCSTGRAAR